MSLTQQFTYKGLEVPESYLQITSFYVQKDCDTWKADVYVTRFTNKSKEFPIEDQILKVDGISEFEISIPTLYDKIKPYFEGAIDS